MHAYGGISRERVNRRRRKSKRIKGKQRCGKAWLLVSSVPNRRTGRGVAREGNVDVEVKTRVVAGVPPVEVKVLVRNCISVASYLKLNTARIRLSTSAGVGWVIALEISHVKSQQLLADQVLPWSEVSWNSEIDLSSIVPHLDCGPLPILEALLSNLGPYGAGTIP